MARATANKKRQPYNPALDTMLIEVDDPYERGAKLTAQRRTSDVVGRLFSQGNIDKAQFEACRMFDALKFSARTSTVSVTDTTKEPVDGGGGIREPITDKTQRAAARLAEIRLVLGVRAYRIVEAVVCENMTLKEVSGSSSKIDARITAKTFKDACNDMAEIFGFSGKSTGNRRASLSSILYDAEVILKTGEGRQEFNIVYDYGD